jgi:hypothetical protein
LSRADVAKSATTILSMSLRKRSVDSDASIPAPIPKAAFEGDCDTPTGRSSNAAPADRGLKLA